MTVELALPALGSLLRKAAVDAGFDLEPEIDGSWWRLRASGAPGVAWVRPAGNLAGAWLALPIADQLAVACGTVSAPLGAYGMAGAPTVLPAGAAGAVSFTTAEALHDALRRVWAHRAYTPEQLAARWEAEVAAALGGAVEIANGTSTTDSMSAQFLTEVVATVRRRVGQDLFREALIDMWEGRCAVTGLAVPELLRASHAKPWAVANDKERLNPYNGLLLAVHLDALFDRGLLAFDERGRGLVSSQLKPDALRVLGIRENEVKVSVLPAHIPFLAYHRIHLFRS